MMNIRPLSITGLVIFFMGLITLNPEIYLSGFMVLLASVSMQMKQFEAQRQEMGITFTNTIPMVDAPIQNETPAEFYAW